MYPFPGIRVSPRGVDARLFVIFALGNSRRYIWPASGATNYTVKNNRSFLGFLLEALQQTIKLKNRKNATSVQRILAVSGILSFSGEMGCAPGATHKIHGQFQRLFFQF
jgi:glycerol dehydrogenase-like iron-containing ADH family enzyme